MKIFASSRRRARRRPMYRFRGSFSKTKPCGTSATTRRYSTRCCWTEPAFPGRTATSRAGRHDSAVLPLGTGANQTPPQPPERHADLPGAGVQRLDYPKKQGLGKPALITLNYPADAKLIVKEEPDAQN